MQKSDFEKMIMAGKGDTYFRVSEGAKQEIAQMLKLPEGGTVGNLLYDGDSHMVYAEKTVNGKAEFVWFNVPWVREALEEIMKA